MSKITLDVPVVVDQVFVDVGDTVERGDTLFTVDREATIEAITSQSGGLDLFGNYQELLAGGALSGSTYEELQSKIDELMQNQKTAQAELLPKMVIAPISGKIIETNLNTFALASAGQNLMTIMDGSEMRVRTEIGEEMISHVELYMPAVISGTGFKGKEFSGQVTMIYPTASTVISAGASKKVIQALVDIQNPDESLKPGYSAKVEIVTDRGEDLMIIPYEVVAQDEENRQYVYILRNGFAFRQYIVTGREGDDGIEVLSGLEYTDVLMLNPGSYTAEYLRVKIRGEEKLD